MTHDTAPLTTETSAPSLSRTLTLTMSAAAGVAVANIYYNQPMIGIISRDFADGSTSLVPTVTQLGYAAGLFLLVPLGDFLDRRRQIAGQFLLLTVALSLAAMAPVEGVLLGASMLIGMMATVAQLIVPLAAQLAPVEKRGQTVGVVMSGLLCGILLSRTLSGLVATHAGWREMFWLAVPLALIAAAVMYRALPSCPPAPVERFSYPALLGSLGSLWRELPTLRKAAATQALVFAGFSAFWTVLAFQLASPGFARGADVAGGFGIIGAVGILAAPLAGRFADKVGARVIVVTGVMVAVVAWLVFWSWLSLAGLIVGVMLLDFGMQSALVSNQHLIYQLRPEARARINTLFMGGMFLGGAAGSAGAVAAWHAGGWQWVSYFGIAVTVAALAVQLLVGKHEKSAASK